MLGLSPWSGAALASDANPFENGWSLDRKASELRFISIKQGNIAETNHFEQLSGEIDQTGDATVRVTLNSVQTYIDIRDVRLRFLFFETFRHPLARIDVRIDRGSLNDLDRVKRKIVPMEYTLSMHGEAITRTERVTLFLIDEDTVAVSNTDPIFLGVSDFDLYRGLLRLQEAANVDISPLAIVSFDFTFTRNAAPAAPAEAEQTGSSAQVAALVAALGRIADWNADKPDAQTCVARILTLGRLDSVRFETLSARISESSLTLLQAYADALVRCPTLRVRIDGLIARGEDKVNALATQRAQAISRYLWSRGVQRSRMNTADGGLVTAASEPVGSGRARFTVLD